MGLKPKAFVVLIVQKNGGILYTNAEFHNAATSEPIKNIDELNYNPKLSELLKLYQSSGNYHTSPKTPYKITDLSNGSEIEVVFKTILEDNSPVFSIELHTLNPIDNFQLDIEQVIKSVNKNDLFLIISDSSGTINFFSDNANHFLNNTFNSLKRKKLSDIGDKLLTTKDNKKFRTALFDGKNWQQDIKIILEKENYIRLRLLPIRDANNRVSSFILFGIDVTKLMKENVAYQKVGKLAQSVMDNVPGLISIFREKEEKIILGDANTNYIKAFGLNKRIVLNQDINTIFTSDFLKLLHKVIKTATVKRTAYFKYTIGKDKSVHYGGKVVCVSKLLGEENFYIITMRDITDLLTYEKQLKKSYSKETYINKLKTSFLMNMAIEIRTPYNSIVAYSNMIDEFIEEGDYDSVKELLSSTKDVLKRVSNLFDNVTEVSQIEAGNVEMRRVPLDCNEVVRLAYFKIKDDVEQKKLEFEVKLSPEKLTIKADWVKIERVIFLLLDNAIKYSSKGKITLEIERENNFAHINIIDTGKGMSDKELNQLLEPFNIQEDDVGISEGAGLGLTIASNYTKLMGGQFNIESKKEKGTKIALSFPLIDE